MADLNLDILQIQNCNTDVAPITAKIAEKAVELVRKAYETLGENYINAKEIRNMCDGTIKITWRQGSNHLSARVGEKVIIHKGDNERKEVDKIAVFTKAIAEVFNGS